MCKTAAITKYKSNYNSKIFLKILMCGVGTDFQTKIITKLAEDI